MMRQHNGTRDRALAPVVGIVLLVGLVIVLAGVTAVFLMNTSSALHQPPPSAAYSTRASGVAQPLPSPTSEATAGEAEPSPTATEETAQPEPGATEESSGERPGGGTRIGLIAAAAVVALLGIALILGGIIFFAPRQE